MGIEIFDDRKTAAVDIEMDVSLFEIGSDCLPDLHFRMPFFDFTPGLISDPVAMRMRRDKKKIEISSISFYPDHHSSNDLAVFDDAVSLSLL